MKLRITQKGFENYTGQMGMVNFISGLSTENVEGVHAARIAGGMECRWEDGSAANPAELLIASYNSPVPTLVITAPVAEAATNVVKTKTFTEAELSEIADKQGVAGLRDIAKDYGVKGKSIRELIDGILRSSGSPVITTSAQAAPTPV